MQQNHPSSTSTPQVPGQDLPRKDWTTLNRLRTGWGSFAASMQEWGLADSAHCECVVT